MSAALEPEQDTALALQLMSVRRTATDEEFGKLLSKLLGTCRHEGFRIAIKALEIILKESELASDTIRQDKPLHPPCSKCGKPVVMTKDQGWQWTCECWKSKYQYREVLGPTLHVTPMRTKEDALAVHQKNHPEMYNEDGTRKPTGQVTAESFQKERDMEHVWGEGDESVRARKPEAFGKILDAKPGKGHRQITDEGKDHIRERAAAHRITNNGKLSKKWVGAVAEEYDVSESLIYNIIYTDPSRA